MILSISMRSSGFFQVVTNLFCCSAIALNSENSTRLGINEFLYKFETIIELRFPDGNI